MNDRLKVMVDLDRITPDLDALNDEELRIVIDADLRGRLRPEIAAALRSPEYVDRWYWLLSQIALSVNGQLRTKAEDHTARRLKLRARQDELTYELAAATRKGEFIADWERAVASKAVEIDHVHADYLTARNRVLRFQSGLRATIAEARRIRREVHGEAVLLSEERDALADEVDGLRAAIEEHRRQRALVADPREADEELWAVLDADPVNSVSAHPSP